MAPYTISYLGPDGDLVDRRMAWFEHDDHAIDTVGNSDHPYEMQIHQIDRFVAGFPPLRSGSLQVGRS